MKDDRRVSWKKDIYKTRKGVNEGRIATFPSSMEWQSYAGW